MLLSGLASFSFTTLQSSEVIYKDWTHIAESPKHYEVEYRVVNCGSQDQIQLFLFNENIEQLKAEFSLEIVNTADGRKTVKEVAFVMDKMTMYKTLCDSGTELDALKIPVPAGYDPKNITLKVIFKA